MNMSLVVMGYYRACAFTIVGWKPSTPMSLIRFLSRSVLVQLATLKLIHRLLCRAHMVHVLQFIAKRGIDPSMVVEPTKNGLRLRHFRTLRQQREDQVVNGNGIKRSVIRDSMVLTRQFKE